MGRIAAGRCLHLFHHLDRRPGHCETSPKNKLMEPNFIRYLQDAFEEFGTRTQGDADAQRIAADPKPSLPELFTLLGSRPFQATPSAATPADHSKEEIARFLVNVFQNKLKPSQVLSRDIRDPQFQAVAESLLTAAAKSRGI